MVAFQPMHGSFQKPLGVAGIVGYGHQAQHRRLPGVIVAYLGCRDVKFAPQTRQDGLEDAALAFKRFVLGNVQFNGARANDHKLILSRLGRDANVGALVSRSGRIPMLLTGAHPGLPVQGQACTCAGAWPLRECSLPGADRVWGCARHRYLETGVRRVRAVCSTRRARIFRGAVLGPGFALERSMFLGQVLS